MQHLDGSSDGGSDGMTEPEVVFTGDFTIVNGIDLQTIQPYTRIAGTLFIKPSGGLTEVSLPNLLWVVDGLFLLRARHDTVAVHQARRAELEDGGRPLHQ